MAAGEALLGGGATDETELRPTFDCLGGDDGTGDNGRHAAPYGHRRGLTGRRHSGGETGLRPNLYQEGEDGAGEAHVPASGCHRLGLDQATLS